jgi:biotin transport system substrate-specific component
VPTSPPFTLQTFAVFAAALLLGRRAGTASVLAYLVLGALGAPVFSGFGGGIGVLVGPTGGYLIGFLFAAWIAGALAEGDAPLGRRILGCALGLAACYAFGTAWFVAVSLRAGREMSVGSALGLCVAPFLIPDAAKIALALLLPRRILQRLYKE